MFRGDSAFANFMAGSPGRGRPRNHTWITTIGRAMTQRPGSENSAQAAGPGSESRLVLSPGTLDLRTQNEMGWRASGTHSAADTGTPSRCVCMSHRQPSGHSRSLLQDCTPVRRDAGITGFAPGHSQVADPFGPRMQI